MTETFVYGRKDSQIRVPFSNLVANIKIVFNRATKTDVARGSEWYYRANSFARIISNETNVPLFIVSLVIAAISPRHKWFFDLEKSGNLKSALNVIEATLAGKTADDVKVATFNRNKEKAFDILADYFAGHDDPEYFNVKYFSKSPKTWNFANNIYNPNSDSFVTIDGHATNLALDPFNREILANALDLTARDRYNILVRAYRTIADEIGLRAWQVQAITWGVYR